ncbi:MAG: NfeD family protein [Prevotellaceae bacterium]|jgi:membrane protein implicated in regulation of membrane protease activity|nr:NfeD family protein [Prevotellaceae bacterium]
MEIWWTSLDLFQKVMWCIAIPSSIIFIVQMIMTFAGMDSDGGLDIDAGEIHDGGMPFQLFTFRNLINFFLGFSWTAISLYYSIESKIVLTIIAALVGLFLVTVVMAIFYFMSRMEQSGNISINDTLGLTATVYYPISEARNRAGKVQISVRGAIREYDAITDGTTLKTGEVVKVKQVIEGNILLVEKL